MADNVNHETKTSMGCIVKDPTNPSYFKDGVTSIECIEAMELIFDWYDVQAFCWCNAFKYIWRHKHKNGLEDLDKAQWYLEYAKNIYLRIGMSEDMWSDHVANLQHLIDIKRKQWLESH